MKTKFIALTAVITLIAFTAQAQQKSDRQKITFGVRAGVNFHNASWKGLFGDDDVDTKFRTGFNLGVNAEIPLSQKFYVQPGILFHSKGAQLKHSDLKYIYNYIEVPVNILYKPVVGKGKLLLGAGPYIAMGVGGKVFDRKIKFSNEADYTDPTHSYLKRIDAGGNFLAGYELNNKFSIQWNVQFGLINVYPKKVKDQPTTVNTARFKNSGFGFSVGYRF